MTINSPFFDLNEVLKKHRVALKEHKYHKSSDPYQVENIMLNVKNYSNDKKRLCIPKKSAYEILEFVMDVYRISFKENTSLDNNYFQQEYKLIVAIEDCLNTDDVKDSYFSDNLDYQKSRNLLVEELYNEYYLPTFDMNLLPKRPSQDFLDALENLKQLFENKDFIDSVLVSIFIFHISYVYFKLKQFQEKSLAINHQISSVESLSKSILFLFE